MFSVTLATFHVLVVHIAGDYHISTYVEHAIISEISVGQHYLRKFIPVLANDLKAHSLPHFLK